MNPKRFRQTLKALLLFSCYLILTAAVYAKAEDSPFRAGYGPRTSFITPKYLALLNTPDIPDHLTLQENKATIGEIIIKRGNVFDLRKPEENIALFRFANRIHILTQESVIRNQLLFKSGDYFSQRIMEESERMLRANDYIFDADIHPIRYNGNVVDIEVVTRDVWTLKGSINFSRQGGSNELSADIQESNLFGYGKDLKFSVGSNVDRKETLLAYKDKQLLGSHNSLSLLYNDKSDGITKSFELVRPFFSLQSTWALGVSALNNSRIDSVYSNGEIINKFKHIEEEMSLFGGLSEGYINRLVYRWIFGYNEEKNTFRILDDYPAALTPENRDYRYPWLSLQIYEDHMIKTTHINQINRTEDLNLGNEVSMKLGWSSHHLGAINEGMIFDFTANMAFKPTPDKLLLFTPYFNGRYADDRTEDARLGFNSKFYIPNFNGHVFYMSLKGELLESGYLGEELLLGGDSGLRGYPLRYQTGDQLYLFTVEQRFYTSWHWFQLAYVGALVFYDIGRAWSDSEPNGSNTGPLRDAGIGLRLASSRSSSGIILHADLAFPLDGGSDIDKMQFVLTTTESF